MEIRKSLKSKTQPKNLELFKINKELRYGGELRKNTKNRGYRPLDSKSSMHVVLRSTIAKDQLSFRHKNNYSRVKAFLFRFSKSKGIKILSAANVGNHIHLHVRIPNRTLYIQWIRGLTSGIAMLVAGPQKLKELKGKFWDYRPFTRVIRSLNAHLKIHDYILINQLEGLGHPRMNAEIFVQAQLRC